MGSGERAEAKKLTKQQGEIAGQSVDLSKQITDLAMPWLEQAGSYYSDVTKGGRAMEKAMGPEVNAVSSQYTQALRGMQERLPPGGQRDRALRDWQIGRAGAIGGTYAGGAREALDRLAALGSGSTGMGLGGYGQAISGLGAAAQANAQMAGGKSSAVGGMAGAGGAIAAAAIAA